MYMEPELGKDVSSLGKRANSDSISPAKDETWTESSVVKSKSNRNSLIETTSNLNTMSSPSTFAGDPLSGNSKRNSAVFISTCVDANRVSSIKTDTTTSDLVTRPSIDSVEDDEDNRFEGRVGSHGTNSLNRQDLFGFSSPTGKKFQIGEEEEQLSEDDAAFEDHPISSEDNDVILNDHDEDEEDDLETDENGMHRMKYHITLTETDSVFPLNFASNSTTMQSNSVGGNYNSNDNSSLSRSGASIASSLASFSGNMEMSASCATGDTVCLAMSNEVDSEPAQYVLKMILAQFMSTTNLKIEELLLKDIQYHSCKPLQFGEDPVFDQLLESLYEVSEHSLPSILRGLFHWYDSLTSSVSRNQTLAWLANSTHLSASSAYNHQLILDKRDLYLDFALGMGLLQACKQLEKHPVEEELLVKIESIPFKHYFKSSQKRRNAASKPILFALVNLVADLYAQLIGELLKTRFTPITSWFKSEFRALKRTETSAERTQSFVYLIMGLRFFRVKMFPIQEFDMSFQFLHELARYFQDPVLSKEKEIRHAFAGLLAEILLPVAAVVKNEVNIPAVKNLVKSYFDSTREASSKKKHAVAMFPLVTCLLAISHTQYFTQQWTSFVSECIASLRNKDTKISRAALESLYRLLWVYMVRIKEDNVNSGQKLQPIINALFPKNSRNLNPRDMPLMIYVKIIHFIAQEKLDLAMREIIFELLQIPKLPKIAITPERMIVGIRAFLVIADQLQQQPVEKSPPMPTNSGNLPSGSAQKLKRTFLSHNLTEIAAMNYGLGSYYGPVCKALGVILYHLDQQIGKPMLTHVMNSSPTKEHRDISSALAAADKKPKLDLFRTCIAAIPRLLPLSLTNTLGGGSQTIPTTTGSISSRREVLDLLCRLADHSEDELRSLAISHMGNVIKELRDWRPDVISRLVLFIVRDIPDTMPATIESMIRILIQLISKWKECLQSEQSFVPAMPTSAGTTVTSKTSPPPLITPNNTASTNEGSSKSKSNSLKLEDMEACASSVRKIEGLALCMLCHLRPNTRRLAVMLLKEAHSLASDLKLTNGLNFVPCIVKMDQGLPKILEEMLPHLSPNERFWAATAAQPDMNWMCEKTSSMWCVNAGYELPFECVSTSSTLCSSSLLPTSEDNLNQSGIWLLKSTAVGIRNSFDPWFYCVIHLIDSPQYLKSPGCIEAVNHAWNFVSTRVGLMFTFIEQLTPQEFSKATLTRTPKRPNPINDYYLCVWRNYITLACGGWTSNSLRINQPEASPNTSPPTGDNHNSNAVPSVRVEKRESIGQMLRNVLIPILRGEHIHLKEVTVQAIGFTNSQALKDSVEDFSNIVKEATDRRPDKRRIKKRAELRLMVVRIFAKISERGVISQCLFEHTDRTISPKSSTGNPVANFFYDLIDSYRQCLDHPNSEMADGALREAKIKYSKLIHFMIETAPDVRTSRTFSSEIQRALFDSTSAWCGTLGKIANGKSPPSTEQTAYSDVELAALQAMCSVISSEPDERNAFLCEDSYIYTGLQYMLMSRNSLVYNLACGAVERLFKKNSHNPVLLRWLFHQSFELKSLAISHACFRTLINVCSEMPHSKLQSLDVNAASFVLLALFFADSSDLCIREKALQLLYLLGSKVLGVIDVIAVSVDNSVRPPGSNVHVLNVGIDEEELDRFLTPDDRVGAGFGIMDESFLAATPAAYYKTQKHLSKELSRTRPELTLGILSELSCRFEMTSAAGRETLLKCVLPWMENIELVEPSFIPAVIPLTPLASSNKPKLPQPPFTSRSYQKSSSCKEPALHFTPLSWATGWGSTSATDTLLTNLFYITVKFGSEHSDSLRKIWQSLCNSFHENCAIILRLLLQMVAISSRCSSLLAAAKMVVAFMAKGSKDHVIAFLLSELSYIDAIPNSVKKSTSCPFFTVVSGSTGSSNSHSRAKSDSTVMQIPSTLTTITTSTLPVSSKVSSIVDAQTALVQKTSREKHSTLPPDFYQPPTLGPEKAVSVPAVAHMTASSSLSNVNKSGEDMTAGTSGESHNVELSPSTSSNTGHPTGSSRVASADDSLQVSERNHWLLAWKVSFNRCNERQAKSLPMPVDVFVCPLAKLILNSSSAQVPSGQNTVDVNANSNSNYASGVYALQRCFASLVLCSHLLITDFGCDWTPHITQFLHLSILGLDHGLPVVVSHSRRTLINLVLTQLETDADAASKTLLLKSTDLVVSTLAPPHLHRSESEHHEYSFTEITENDNPPARLAEYLLQNISQPLWTLEDVSPRNQTVTSAKKVSAFVSLLIQLFENHFNGEVPLAYDVRNEWAALSLKMALSSSSRHYASRSFQVYRGLEIAPLSSDVSEILMRLNDTVGEVGEETQGYVVEIMQTLVKISSLIVDQPEFIPQRPLSLFTSTGQAKHSNRNTSLSARAAKSTVGSALNYRKNPAQTHAAVLTSRKPTELDVFYRRTCSYNGPAAEALRSNAFDLTRTAERRPEVPLNFSSTLDSHQRLEMKRRDLKARSQCLPRDFGDTLLSRRGGHGIFDDKLSILCQVFWAVISMLESDFEYEYVLALKLLEQLLGGLKLDSGRHQNALCRVFHQMKWSMFSGLQPLVLKGLTLATALPLTNKILIKFTPCLQKVSFLDSNQRGLVVNILSLLPMLFESYDEPSEMHLECADSIASECNKMSDNVNATAPSRPTTSTSVLSVSASTSHIDEDTISVTSAATGTVSAIAAAWNNLATVMRMYSRQTDVKDSVSWLGAVCQYLGEAVYHRLVSLISYLSELLERGPTSYQNCLLHMICSFIQIIDLQKLPKERFNTTTVHTLLHRFMLQNNPEWKSALTALKLIVTRSSTLCSPSSSQRRVEQITSAIEEAVIYRRQIPGRTLSFSYNFPVPPIGGCASVAQTLASLTKSVPVTSTANSNKSADSESASQLATPSRRKSSSDAINNSFSVDADGNPKPNLRSMTSVQLCQEAASNGNKLHADLSNTAAVQSTVVSRSPSVVLGRQVSVGNASINESQNSNWRRPFNSQKRVRDKLAGVIRSFGRTPATLARTPSVVFSSTTDVDFQTVVSANSNIGAGSAAYENQIQSHPPSSMGMGNGESTPAAGTTGHGSIDDMHNITGMDLGTPSGRDGDTVSLDVFADFDFLDNSEFEDDIPFPFGLRPSESSMPPYMDAQTPKCSSQSVGKQLFAESGNNASDMEEIDQTLTSTNHPKTGGRVQLISPHDGVNIDESSEEEEEDEEESDEDEVVHDDDLDSSGEGDDNSGDNDEGEGGHSRENVVESSNEAIDSTDQNRLLPYSSSSYSAAGRIHSSPTREMELGGSLQPTAFLILSPQMDMIDIRLFTLNLHDFHFYWIEAVNDFLSPPLQLHNLNTTARNDNNATHYSGVTSGADPEDEESDVLNSLVSSPSANANRGCLLENSNLIVHTMPSLYLFLLRFIQDYSQRGLTILSNCTECAISTIPELTGLFSTLKSCFETLISAQKFLPVVMVSSSWKQQVSGALSERQKRALEKNLRQFVLESSEAVSTLTTAIDTTSHTSFGQLRELQSSIEHVNRSGTSEREEGGAIAAREGEEVQRRRLCVELAEGLVRSHMQISLLFNQIDKLYNTVLEANAQAPAMSNTNKTVDVSRSLRMFAEFSRTSNDTTSLSNTSPSHARTATVSSIQSSQGDNCMEILNKLLGGDSPTTQDFVFAGNIVRCFRSSSVGNMGVDFTEVTENDQWVEVAADRLILMAMIWNFRVNKKTQGQPDASSFACVMLDDETKWLDQIDSIGANSARLRTQLASLSHKLIADISTEVAQQEHSKTNSLLSNTATAAAEQQQPSTTGAQQMFSNAGNLNVTQISSNPRIQSRQSESRESAQMTTSHATVVSYL